MNATAFLALALLTADPAPAALDKEVVAKGLKWLVKEQTADGYWVGANDSYPTYVTGFAGVAFLMEGSTLTSGKYAPQIRKAVAWLETNTAPNGRIGGKHESEINWDINGHASAALFLICAYDVDDDEPRRERLAKLIRKALAYLVDAQTERGGWGYTITDKNYDDSDATTAVLRTLFAARKVGFDVPRRTTERGVQYLVKATGRNGVLAYNEVSVDINGETPADPTRTAGAASALLMFDGNRPDVLTRWVKSAKETASPVMQNLATNPIAQYQQYNMARTAYGLGEDGHRRIDPAAKGADLMTWSGYKSAAFKPLRDAQEKDGGWQEVFFGRAHTTASALIILQLDNGYLPAFSR